MLNLFEHAERYPNAAGWKDPSTSRDAAEKIERSGRAEALRQRALYLLKHRAMTDKDLAQLMGEDINSIRPRRTELFKQGLVEKTGDRSEGQHVWRAL